jgi:hypothetical protein
MVAPIAFPFFVVTTLLLMLNFPAAILLLLILVVPRVGGYFREAVLNYLIILCSAFLAVSKKRFLLWKKPEDRILLKEEMLLQKGLI